MATTTNYGWTTPDDTGLVKDGASNIRTLGSSIDTTTKALNPSTTLGDIEYRSSTANTNTRLPIGTTDQVLKVVGGVPAWGSIAGGGKVLQVVTATNSSAVQIATTSNTDTGITATITPTADTSKILILITGNYELYRNSTANDINARIMRGATAILTYGSGGFSGIHAASTSNEIVMYNTASIHYLDSPATTSATTYKLQSSVAVAANAMAANWQFAGPSVITLLEIGA
jgi:hypothetical protein